MSSLPPLVVFWAACAAGGAAAAGAARDPANAAAAPRGTSVAGATMASGQGSAAGASTSAPPVRGQGAAGDRVLDAWDAAMAGAADAPARVEAARAAAGPEVPDALRDELRVAEARVALERGDLAAAEKRLAEVLAEQPGSSADGAARALLGVVRARAGRHDEAARLLEGGAAQRVPAGPTRREVIASLVAALCGLQRYGDAARHFAGLAGAAPDGAEREALDAFAVTVLDDRLSFNDVRGLYETLDRARWPAPLVLYKLARIHGHVGEHEESRARFEELVARFPQHPLVARAREHLAQIAKRFVVDPRVVGAVLPLTGEFKAVGQQVMQAIELAMVGAGDVALKVRDDAGDAARAAAAVEALVTEDHAIAILGPLVSGPALAAAYKAEELGVPLVALSRREGLAQVGPHVFRLCLTSSRQARALAAYAMEELGMTRFAILYPNHPYGVELRNFFWDEVERREGLVTAVESYGADAKDFDVPVRKLVGRHQVELRGEYLEATSACRKKETDSFRRRRCVEQAQKNLSAVVDFEAIFIPDYHDKVRLVVPAIAYRDVELVGCLTGRRTVTRGFDGKLVPAACLLGGNGWNHPDVAKQGGDGIDGALFVDGFFAADGRDAVQSFVTHFKERTHREPSLVEAQAYDAAGLVRSLVAGKDPPATRAAMVEALRRVVAYEGAVGVVRVDADGEIAAEPHFLTIKEGVIVPAQSTPEATAPAGEPPEPAPESPR